MQNLLCWNYCHQCLFKLGFNLASDAGWQQLHRYARAGLLQWWLCWPLPSLTELCIILCSACKLKEFIISWSLMWQCDNSYRKRMQEKECRLQFSGETIYMFTHDAWVHLTTEVTWTRSLKNKNETLLSVSVSREATRIIQNSNWWHLVSWCLVYK